MLIVCPNCSRSYLVRAADLGQNQRLVRCGGCQTSWRPEEAQDQTSGNAEIHLKTDGFEALAQNSNESGVKKPPFLKLVTLGATAAAMTGLAIIALNDRAELIVTRAIGWIDAAIPGNGLQGISFANVKTSLDAERGETSLLVEGEIRSDSEILKKLPEIQFTIRDEAENTIFQWMIPAPAPTITKGEAVSFKARLASPPRDAKNINIKFSGAS